MCEVALENTCFEHSWIVLLKVFYTQNLDYLKEPHSYWRAWFQLKINLCLSIESNYRLEYCQETIEHTLRRFLSLKLIFISRYEVITKIYCKTRMFIAILLIVLESTNLPSFEPKRIFKFQSINRPKCLYTLFFIRTSKFCLTLAVLNFFLFLRLKCS